MLQVVKKEGAGICPIQQETAALMVELQLLGQLQLLKIIEQIVRGQHVLALCSVKVVRRQIGACEESLRLLERVNHLVRATMCRHAAEGLKSS